MKLYYHPASGTSRPVLLWAADEGLTLDLEFVDLMTGAHKHPSFSAVNPSQQVPVLEDGDFRLTESSAILKYLADTTGSATYPRELKSRARVNEVMDWLNTGLSRDLGYGFVYPQIFPNHQREGADVQRAHLAWGREKARRWLGILDRDILGDHAYLCGNAITLADYLAIGMLTTGEAAKVDFGAWPRLARWIGTMKAGPNWASVNEPFYTHLVQPYQQASFEAL